MSNVILALNSFMLSGHSHIDPLGWSISNRRAVWLVLISAMFYTNSSSNCKQCRPRSDAAFYGVWSGSTLFPFYRTLGKIGLTVISSSSLYGQFQIKWRKSVTLRMKIYKAHWEEIVIWNRSTYVRFYKTLQVWCLKWILKFFLF